MLENVPVTAGNVSSRVNGLLDKCLCLRLRLRCCVVSYVQGLWSAARHLEVSVSVEGPNGRPSPQLPQLEKKLELELEDGARVIACRFPFPRWTPDHTTGEGIDTVWAYDMSAQRGRGGRPNQEWVGQKNLSETAGLQASSSETRSKLLDVE